MEWSSDSHLVLVGVKKRAVAFARNIYYPEWNCKIDEGLAGLASCKWAPTGRHILTVSDFKMRLTVWSLIDQSVQYITSPKFETKGVDFSPDGDLMALVQKPDDDLMDQSQGQRSDIVSIFGVDCRPAPWSCMFKFAAGSTEAEDIRFTRDGCHLVIWDSPLRCSVQVVKLCF